MVHIYNGILLSHKKDKIMPFAAIRMDLEIIRPSKSERERQISYITDMQNNEHIYKTNKSTDIKKNPVLVIKEKGG